jgi:hypothetical protein
LKFSSATPLNAFIKGCEDSRPVSDVLTIREENGPTWAMILMACEKEQFMLLQHLWSARYPNDQITTLVFVEIVRRGFLPQFLNPNDKRQRDLFQLLGACVENGMTLSSKSV